MRTHHVLAGRVVAAAIVLAGVVILVPQFAGGAPPIPNYTPADTIDPSAGCSHNEPGVTEAPSGSIAGAPTPLNYSTGFEPEQGFVARDGTCVQDTATCGPFTGECGWINGQGSGPYPAPWGVSTSNQGKGLIEPHIDTAHPFSGTQHLRFTHDVCDSTNVFFFATDARIPNDNNVTEGVIGPATHRAMIAISSEPFGVNVNLQPQANSQACFWARMLFFTYGFFYILDDQGSGLGFVPVFDNWDTTGGYREVMIHEDPCVGFRCIADHGGNLSDPPGKLCTDDSDCKTCVGGDNDGAACLGDFQCPNGGTCVGGRCAGRIDYRYDVDGDGYAEIIYQGTIFCCDSNEQFLIYTDNFPGVVDVDDVAIETGDPCPPTCGNLVVEGGEQCDGANDLNCPGRCIAPGGTGPNGEAECTCIIDGLTCDTATPLPNGTTNVITHGGWWTFTADATATAVNTCGSNYDSALALYTGACDSLELLSYNDDCDINSPYGTGAVDPLAPCHPVSSPWESCFCWATTIGQQYWVNDARVSVGADTNITLEKRQTCDAIWNNGACCDGYGGCTDDVAEADCQNAGDQWIAQKLCASDAVNCQTVLGTCCDTAPGAGGACTDGVLEADCQGQYLQFRLGEHCGDSPCLEVKGSCCNGFTGTCSQTIQGNCQGLNMFWTEGQTCANAGCEPIPGACCNHLADDPLSATGTCTDGVIQADCTGENMTWTKATLCANVTCDAVYPAIPTVSEWGIVVLALLLLVFAKVWFWHRKAGRTV